MEATNAQTGAKEDLPDAQAESGFLEGTHTIDAGAKVPVRYEDGGLKLVEAPQLASALRDYGGHIASQEDWEKEVANARYGGVMGGLEAAAAGGARGASLGLSDVAITQGAKLFGGEAAHKKAQEALRGFRTAHPTISTAAEVGGASLPVLADVLSGGAATAPEAAIAGATGAAEAAGGGVLSRGAAGLARASGFTPAALTAKLGAGAESLAARAAEKTLGSTAARSALGRIASQAARTGAAGATEGALYGAGGAISEDALGDSQLNGEKLAASMTHGAMLGLMFGAGIGGGGQAVKEIASPLLRRVGPHIDNLAGERAWASLDPVKERTIEADTRAGGSKAVGKTLLRRGVDLRPEMIEDSVNATQRQIGQELNEFRETHGLNADVSAKDIMAAAQDVLKPLEESAAHEATGVTSGFKRYIDSLLDKLKLQAEPEAEQAVAQAARGFGPKRTPEEITQYLRDNPSAVKGLKFNPDGSAAYPPEIEFHPAPETPTAPIHTLREPVVSFGDMLKQRQYLDDVIKWNQREPTALTQSLRDFRAKLSDLEMASLDKAGRKLGKEGVGEQYQALKRDYQHLTIAQKAASTSRSRMATNNVFSLSDKMFAAAEMSGAVASGHPLGAVAAPAVAMGTKWLRRNYNQVAATTLDRLSKVDLIARAVRGVDAEVDNAIGAFSGRLQPRIRVRRFPDTPDAEATPEKKFEHADSQTRYRIATQEDFEKAHPGLSQSAPNTSTAALAAVNAGVTYLAASKPQPAPPSLLDVHAKPRLNDLAAEEFFRRQQAVHDPVGTITRGLDSGHLSRDEVEAIKATSPKLYEETRSKVLSELARPAASGKPIPYDKALLLSTLFDVPADPSLAPAAVAGFQASYAPQGPAGTSGPGPGVPGGKAPSPPSAKAITAATAGVARDSLARAAAK